MFDTKSIDPSLVTFTELKSPGVRKKDRWLEWTCYTPSFNDCRQR